MHPCCRQEVVASQARDDRFQPAALSASTASQHPHHYKSSIFVVTLCDRSCGQPPRPGWSKGTAWVPAALERSIAAIWAAGRRDRRSRDGHRSVRQSVRAVTTERKPTDPTTAVRWLGDAEIVGAQVAIKKLFCEDGGVKDACCV